MRRIFASIAYIVVPILVFIGMPASAQTITRNASTGTTPNAADFPAAFNAHPTQVGYVTTTYGGQNYNHMFRETIPVVCGARRHLTGLSLEFLITKIIDGDADGDNDAMGFWINGVKKYEINVGAAAHAGIPEQYTLSMGGLFQVGTGPNTLTATYSAYNNPISMLADIQAAQRLSFSIQDDTNIAYAKVTLYCEDDAVPPHPINASPCCPPWTPDLIWDAVQVQRAGPGNSNYAIRFDPWSTLPALHAYIDYLHVVNPAISSLNVEIAVYDQGMNPWPVSHVNASGTSYYQPGANSATGSPSIGGVSGFSLTAGSSVVTRHTNYAATPMIFAGTNAPSTPVPYTPSAWTPSNYPLVPGMWYLVHTGIWTDKIKFFDDKCANNDIFVRLPNMPKFGSGSFQIQVLRRGDKQIQSMTIANGKRIADPR